MTETPQGEVTHLNKEGSLQRLGEVIMAAEERELLRCTQLSSQKSEPAGAPLAASCTHTHTHARTHRETCTQTHRHTQIYFSYLTHLCSLTTYWGPKQKWKVTSAINTSLNYCRSHWTGTAMNRNWTGWWMLPGWLLSSDNMKPTEIVEFISSKSEPWGQTIYIRIYSVKCTAIGIQLRTLKG